jgi:serine/threonine protein kinase
MVCIADLGLSIKADDPRAKNEKCGTPAYVDPEVLQGNGFSLKSDIFSLGSLMFNLITRKLIFKGNTINEVLYRNKHQNPNEMID